MRDEIVDLFYNLHGRSFDPDKLSYRQRSREAVRLHYFLDNGEILVNEEKDVLLDSFGILQLPKSEIAALPAGAVRGVKGDPLRLRSARSAGKSAGV